MRGDLTNSVMQCLKGGGWVMDSAVQKAVVASNAQLNSVITRKKLSGEIEIRKGEKGREIRCTPTTPTTTKQPPAVVEPEDSGKLLVEAVSTVLAENKLLKANMRKIYRMIGEMLNEQAS